MFKGPIRPVRQDESHECILACLAMIATCHGGRVRLSDLRRQFPNLSRGGTLRDMMEIARALRLGPRALKAEISALDQLRLPCVIHWGFDHFVVLEKVSARFIQIVDPATGRRRIDRQDFSRQYTGVALELIPLPGFYQQEAEEGARKLPPTILPLGLYRKPIALFILLSALALAFSLVSPLAVQIIVDEVIVKGDYDLLLVVAGAFLVANAIGAVSAYLQGLHILRQSATTRLSLTYDYLDRLLSYPWTYFTRRNLGNLVAQYNSLHFLVNFVVRNVGTLISDTLFVATVSIILLLIEPGIASIVLALNGAIVLIRIGLLGRARKLQDGQVVDQANEEAYFVETMRGISSVKANVIELNRLTGNVDRTVKAANSSFRLSLFGLRYGLFMQLIKSAEMIVVLYLLALAVLQAQMTIGVMYAFYAYRQFLDQRLTSLVDAMSEVLNLKVHRDRLMEAFDADTSIVGGMDVGQFMKFEGDVALKDVSFRVDNGRKVILDRFSATAPRGSFIHVRGPTGAGKTTLLKIILNTVSADSGELFVDGVPITDGSLSILRNSVGVVLQEDTLFKGTIMENVALFDDRLDFQRVEECCKTCLIHEEIMRLPLRYQSQVGDMGANLSTGQQQRLLLARSLYRNPAILVLDEATANLNEEVERQILDNLKALRKTVIFASHSSNVSRYADDIWDLGIPGAGETRQKSAELA